MLAISPPRRRTRLRSHRNLSFFLTTMALLTLKIAPPPCARDITATAHGLTAISISLTLMLSSRLLILQFWHPILDLSHPTTTTHPRCLSPTDPAKGHNIPSSSLSLTLSDFVQILVYWLFFFLPIFSL
uniref:Uncharacterized protein n=1 Tax=Fagus sylvatica TaxID=28930 RepID=A0A2N9IRI4_FAGSY